MLTPNNKTPNTTPILKKRTVQENILQKACIITYITYDKTYEKVTKLWKDESSGKDFFFNL